MKRILLEVTTDNGKTVDAMVYVYQGTTQNLNQIESGNYRTILRKDIQEVFIKTTIKRSQLPNANAKQTNYF